MKNFLFIIIIGIFFISSCKKKNNEQIAPPPQEIVTSDTSGLTGELTVESFYIQHGSNTITPLYHCNIFLYASYNDIMQDLNNNTENLALYRMTTAIDNNDGYFGYINYGNYYVLGFKDEAGYYYEKVSIVQVRPGRTEHLNLYLDEILPSKNYQISLPKLD